MIRVTFDRDYIDYLQDYYVRNECIREQQYLSEEKLLHLAAFCLSKVAIVVDDGGEPNPNAAKAEAALDAVQQLSVLCAKAIQSDRNTESTIIVNGHTNGERQDDDRQTTTEVSATFVGKSILRMLRLQPAARSVKTAVVGEKES